MFSAIDRWRWIILPTQTRCGASMPPLISGKTLVMASTFPLLFVTTAGDPLRPLLLLFHFFAFLLVAVSGVERFTTFREGMQAGREELAEEMWRAWQEGQMQPAEYLCREMWTGEDVGRAAKQVRRSAGSRGSSS